MLWSGRKYIGTILLTVGFLTVTQPTFASVSVRQPVDPACQPAAKPAPTPGPTPDQNPSLSPTPVPIPLPKPSPVEFPKPPSQLTPDEPEPESTGSKILDDALLGQAPKSVLPLWHGYPWKKGQHLKLWTAHLVQSLRADGQSLSSSIPSDVVWYCPNYAALDEEHRIVFWARFVSVLAEQESSYDSFQVTYAPTIGPKVFSTGLLMLSLVSAKSSVYGCTMIQTQDDLFDWRKNMSCAVKIMSALIRRDGAIAWNLQTPEPHSWQGLARYWDPVRDSRIKNATGRQCISEMIELRTPDWKREAESNRHPSIKDSEYVKAGETRYERLLRQINELPFCH